MKKLLVCLLVALLAGGYIVSTQDQGPKREITCNKEDLVNADYYTD